MTRLELFYDIVSPFSYLAFKSLERYRDVWQLDVVLRPAYLGGVMKATGNQPPAQLPARGMHMARDLYRQGQLFDVKVALPSTFPGRTLPAMRLLTLVRAQRPALLWALSDELWRRHWGEDVAIDGDDDLVAACGAVGVDDVTARAWIAQTSEPSTKDALKAATDEAVERGAFGFPAMFATVQLPGESEAREEMWFGSDRLESLSFALGKPWYGPALQRKP